MTTRQTSFLAAFTKDMLGPIPFKRGDWVSCDLFGRMYRVLGRARNRAGYWLAICGDPGARTWFNGCELTLVYRPGRGQGRPPRPQTSAEE